MSQQAANLTNVDAVRILREALAAFRHAVGDGLVALDLEGRRPIEWIDSDRTRYWPAQVQKASNDLAEARLALQRCELTIDGEDARYCYDERKIFEKAKRRLELCEEKVRAVKRWRMRIHKEVEEFQVQLARLQGYLDNDLVAAMASLGRMAAALEKYVHTAAPAGAGPGAGAAPEGNQR
jgi:hypothetical protein